MDIKEILSAAVASGVSDIFIIAGAPLSFKINGVISVFKEGKLLPRDTGRLRASVRSGRPINAFFPPATTIFHLSSGLARCRRASTASIAQAPPSSASSFGIPDYRKLNIPDCVHRRAQSKMASCGHRPGEQRQIDHAGLHHHDAINHPHRPYNHAKTP